jgi:hypothetical protein
MTKPPRFTFASPKPVEVETGNLGFVLALIGLSASFAVIGWVMA